RMFARRLAQTRQPWVRAWAERWFPWLSLKKRRPFSHEAGDSSLALAHRPSFFELERRKAPTALSVADLAVPPLALAGGLSSLPIPIAHPTTLDRLDQDAATTEDPVFAPPADANRRFIFSDEAQEQLPEDTPIEFGAIPNASPRAAEVDQALSSYVFADV